MIIMAIERTYNIPLRKEFLKAQKYKRAKKAGTALRQFLVRHMKSENVKIGAELNHKIWEHGIQNPPHHVKVTAIKEDDGTVKAELFGFKFKEAKPKEEPKKGITDKIKETVTGKHEGKKGATEKEVDAEFREVEKKEHDIEKKAKKEEKTEEKKAPKEEKKPEAKPAAKEASKPKPHSEKKSN